MSEITTTTNSLSGSFLIAHPSLRDPNFRRTVIMLPNHDSKQGGFGLILNRPTGKVIGDLLNEQALGHLASVPVLHGGPVQHDQLLLAAFRWHPQTRLMECRHHIPIEEAEQLSAAQYHTVRAFIGYAGWSAGQLESELMQQTWLVRRADREEVLEAECTPNLWRDLTASFGPWFRIAADAPENPSKN